MCEAAAHGACWSRYQKRGFVFGYISHYEGMETGDIVARVVEGRVNKVNVVHVDDEGNPARARAKWPQTSSFARCPSRSLAQASSSDHPVSDMYGVPDYHSASMQLLAKQELKVQGCET